MVLKCLFEKTLGLRPETEKKPSIQSSRRKATTSLETDKSLSSSMTLGRLMCLKNSERGSGIIKRQAMEKIMAFIPVGVGSHRKVLVKE